MSETQPGRAVSLAIDDAIEAIERRLGHRLGFDERYDMTAVLERLAADVRRATAAQNTGDWW